jgi:pyrroline-5-carboxylate reductase
VFEGEGVAKRIGFIGTGQMARALAAGFLKGGQVTPDLLIGSDPSPESRRLWEAQTNAPVADLNVSVCRQSDVLILAVKPQTMMAVLKEIRPALSEDALVISIAAGVPLRTLATVLGEERRLVRVMPNTPCLVGASATGFALGGSATEDDAQYVRALFDCVGISFALPEPLLDAVTGLSGSGPAYAYQVIEALSDGGVRAGLPRNVATTLAAQTLLGAAKMVLETGKHPGELKDMVTSPAGTTIAGLAVLESRAVRSAFLDAVVAATERSRELGKD